MDKINFHNISEINDINDNISGLMKNGELDIEITYLSNFSSTKNLRDIISNICYLLNISNNNIYKITLIIDELNNNAIEY
jgi:ABC-type molybdate transport system substrate-binding protein